MGDIKRTITLDYETLTAVGARLSRHAEDITNAARQDIANDLRLAAVMASKFASLRFRVAEIAPKAIDHPEWDRAAFARDLRAALDDTAEAN